MLLLKNITRKQGQHLLLTRVYTRPSASSLHCELGGRGRPPARRTRAEAGEQRRVRGGGNQGDAACRRGDAAGGEEGGGCTRRKSSYLLDLSWSFLGIERTRGSSHNAQAGPRRATYAGVHPHLLSAFGMLGRFSPSTLFFIVLSSVGAAGGTITLVDELACVFSLVVTPYAGCIPFRHGKKDRTIVSEVALDRTPIPWSQPPGGATVTGGSGYDRDRSKHVRSAFILRSVLSLRIHPAPEGLRCARLLWKMSVNRTVVATLCCR